MRRWKIGSRCVNGAVAAVLVAALWGGPAWAGRTDRLFERGTQAYANEAFDEAARYWRKAARKGHAEAQYALAGLYMEGKGVPQDFTEAAERYRQAAERGHAMAQYRLGMLHVVGRGVPRDRGDAERWLKRAAAQRETEPEAALRATTALLGLGL